MTTLSPATRAVLARLRRQPRQASEPEPAPEPKATRRTITMTNITAYMTWVADNRGSE